LIGNNTFTIQFFFFFISNHVKLGDSIAHSYS
jgi:hypothetical protein